MNNKEFTQYVERILEDCKSLLLAKGHDYSGLENRLSNFLEGSKEIDVPVMKFLWPYLDKHLRAIKTYVRGERLTGENVQEKIKDSINYLLLLSAIIHEYGSHQVSITDISLKN